MQNTMARGLGKGPGEKMKNEAVRNKMKEKKGKRKRRKGKGESDFLLIYGTLLFIIVNMTFHDPLRGKLAAGKKYKN